MKKTKKSEETLATALVLKWFKQITLGLHHCHSTNEKKQHPLIHDDLKPENIVVTDYNDLTKVKLIDFGLACKNTKTSKEDFAKCGTLLYTPPEQVLNNFAYAKVSNPLLLTHPCRKLTCGRSAL